MKQDLTIQPPWCRHLVGHPSATGDGVVPVTWGERLATLPVGSHVALERRVGSWASEVAQPAAANAAWPVTRLLAPGDDARTLDGAYAWVVDSANATPVRLDGQVVGTMFADDLADYCVLGNITPARGTWRESREVQVNSLYERTEEALAEADMQFNQVVRSWMFLDRLLEWYDDFNCLRTVFLEMHDVFNRLLPASTGVGVRNPFGAAAVADFLAIRPKSDRLSIREVGSPRQCPATDYQSSFSRAVLVESPRERTMMVSGTASIGADGETLHVGDMRRQVEETLDVVEQLLGSQQFGWGDVTRGIAYVKRPADADIFGKVCAERGIPTAPYLTAHADICRHALLFELELDVTQRKL